MKNNYLETYKSLANIRSTDTEHVYKEVIKVLHANHRPADLKVFLSDDKEFPLLSAVSKGGKKAFYGIIQNYSQLTKSKHILIGKGIVFDSGGYDLKPGKSMSSMHFDKTGAILSIILGLKHPKLPVITFFGNNMVGPDGFVPGEILQASNGTKVLIGNTDAEGRLGLADSLLIAKKLAPKAHATMLATLTGAAAYYSGDGLFATVNSTDDNVLKHAMSLYLSGDAKLWPMPRNQVYDDSMKTKIIGADISNDSSLRAAGSQTAFSFLKHFHNNSTLVDIAAMDSDQDGNNLLWGIIDIERLLKI